MWVGCRRSLGFCWWLAFVEKIQLMMVIKGGKGAEFKQTSQELRMLSRSLSDCKSQLLNVMIQDSQFVTNSQLCH